MNIFVLSTDPRRAAKMHCDKHCVKMILESVQLLYSVWWFYITNFNSCWPDDTIKVEPYKATHMNHPCAIWTRCNKNHYNWLIKMCKELCKEYSIRYNKIHKSELHLNYLKNIGYPSELEIENSLTEKVATIKTPNKCDFFICAIENKIFNKCVVYKNNQIDCVNTYRNYYKYKDYFLLKSEMKWKTKTPYWF